MRVFRNRRPSAHRCSGTAPLPTLRAVEDEQLRSGDPVFRCGEDLRIVEWNEAAEQLTGIRALEAVGGYCWDAIGGRDDQGHLVCHPGCSIARLALDGWPVSCANLVRAGPSGPQRITISTIVLRNGGGSTILHPMRAAAADPAPVRTPQTDEARLTGRQLEILAFLADGVRVREIAERLSLSEATVRNHVRALLNELGVHSQLQAVARARELGLL
jgi:DNA-binding CsgD family transcriptional regulator